MTMTQFTLKTAILLYRQQAKDVRNSDKDNTEEYWESRPYFNELRTCVGKSFGGTDDVAGEPLFDWASSHLEQMEWFDALQRQETCSFIMGFPVFEDMAKKNTLIVAKREADDENGKKGQLISTAIVMEYDPSKQGATVFSKFVKGWRMLRAFLAMWRSGPIPVLFSDRTNKQAASLFEKRGTEMFRHLERSHKEEGPQYVHWYVHIVAVNPEYNGKGYGRELMEKVNEFADKAEATLYLECGVRNIKFYEKMGYVMHAIKTVPDPADPKAEPGRAAIMVRQPVHNA